MTGRPRHLALIHLLGAICVLVTSFNAAALAAGSSTGAEAVAEPRPIRSFEGITEYELDNGLQVLICPDPYTPTITVNMTYRVGSRHEGAGEAGMAHMLEHLLIGRTEDFPSLREALDRTGAEYNGSTWYDRTNFFETLMASEENLDLALHVEAERMVNADFGAEELTREKGVIANEFEMDENDPAKVLSQRMLSSAFLWHAYGRTPMGNLSDIQGYPLESVQSFYERHYRPDNATLIIAGRFDPDRALRLVAKYFAKIPARDRNFVETHTVEPVQDGPRSVTLLRAGDTIAAGVMYHVPAGSHPDSPAILLLREILAAKPAGRLDRSLVKTGVATTVRGNDDALILAEPGVMEIIAEAGADRDARSLVDRVADTVEAVGREGVTEEELKRARARRLRTLRQITSDSGRLATELSEWVALGDWRLFFAFRDGLSTATKGDVDRVARTYLVASNRTAGMFVPETEPARAVAPSGPSIAEILQGYGEKPARAPARAPAAPLPVDDDDWTEKVMHLEVPPGLNVALLRKPTRGGTVVLELRARYGDADTLRAQKAVSTLLPELLARGTTKHDYEQLLERFDLLQSEIRVGGHAGVLSASIESDREHLISAIGLVAEILRSPAFAGDQFEVLKRERRAKLESGLSDPVERCFNAVRRGLYRWPQDSVHYMPTLEEQIREHERISVGKIRTLYSALIGGDHLSVSIVGDFDTGKTLAALSRAFEDWESPHPYSRITVPFKAIEPSKQRILTPDRRMAIVGMATLVDLRDDDPDYPALEIANYVLGGSPSGRLSQRLRHRDGLTYHTASVAEVDETDRSSAFFAYAFCSPDNVGVVHQAMREEVQGWIETGITNAELEEAKTSYLRERAIELADDQQLARVMVRYEELDRSLSFRSSLLAKIKALSTAEVNAALRRLMADAPFVEIEAGDLPPSSGKRSSDPSQPAAITRR
jgi:zinc protease